MITESEVKMIIEFEFKTIIEFLAKTIVEIEVKTIIEFGQQIRFNLDTDKYISAIFFKSCKISAHT